MLLRPGIIVVNHDFATEATCFQVWTWVVLQSIGRSGTSYHVKLKFHLDNVFANFLFASERKCVLYYTSTGVFIVN